LESFLGKLLSGRYGEPPRAESVPLSLKDCSQRLGLKPSDFISQGEPNFFKKSFGAGGRYLIFLVEETDVQSSPVWKAGYYLLPLEAADVLKVFLPEKEPNAGPALPVRVETKGVPPEIIADRAKRWAEESQPLFFKCGCDYLELKLQAPWGLRRQWKAVLRCPKRCQPALTTLM